MTYEEKLELAKSMRAKSIYESNTPEHLKTLYNSIKKEERAIPTSQGDSHVWIYYPEKTDGLSPIYINFHGGGFVRQWRENDGIFCCRLLADNKCIAVDVNYRLAPEHTYPTAIYESYDVIKWVYDHAGELGGDRDNIIIGGHSAGGNIVASVMLLALKRKEFKIKYQILDYPGISSYKRGEEFKAVEGGIPAERMNQFRLLHFKDLKESFEPLASPILAEKEELKGMPDALVITAQMDSFYEDGEAYANKLVEAGATVTMHRFLKSRHGFMINFIDEYEEAMKLYSTAMRAAFYTVK